MIDSNNIDPILETLEDCYQVINKALHNLIDISNKSNLQEYYDEINEELDNFDKVIDVKEMIVKIEAAYHHLPKEKISRAKKFLPKFQELFKLINNDDNRSAIQKLRNYVQTHSNIKNENDELERTKSNGSQEQGQLRILNLQSNEAILKERKKQLHEIKMTSAQIKEITDGIKEEVYNQEHLLNDFENHIVDVKKNTNDANKEILEAKEKQEGNRKKIICLSLFMLFIGLSIAGLLIFIFLSPKPDEQ